MSYEISTLIKDISKGYWKCVLQQRFRLCELYYEKISWKRYELPNKTDMLTSWLEESTIVIYLYYPCVKKGVSLHFSPCFFVEKNLVTCLKGKKYSQKIKSLFWGAGTWYEYILRCPSLLATVTTSITIIAFASDTFHLEYYWEENNPKFIYMHIRDSSVISSPKGWLHIPYHVEHQNLDPSLMDHPSHGHTSTIICNSCVG